MGGGYVNTELRQMTDNRLFDYIDFLTFDDKLPLLHILKGEELIRTLYRNNEGEIVSVNFDSTANFKFAEIATQIMMDY